MTFVFEKFNYIYNYIQKKQYRLYGSNGVESIWKRHRAVLSWWKNIRD